MKRRWGGERWCGFACGFFVGTWRGNKRGCVMNGKGEGDGVCVAGGVDEQTNGDS